MPPIDPRNIEVVDSVTAKFLRRQSPSESLRQVSSSHELAAHLVRGGIRGEHPDWSEAQVQAEAEKRMFGDSVAVLATRS